ncbi:MAG: class I SAM-dependent methyltransferase [Limnospira maxima]
MGNFANLTASYEVLGLNEQAGTCLACGRFSEAIAACHQAIKTQPHHFGAYHILGQVLQAQHKNSAAVRAYRIALELNPDCTKAQQGLSQILSGEDLWFPPGDYVSSGLRKIKCDRYFPNLVVDNISSKWQYHRREIPHNRYVDQQFPTVGFITRDEAHILYNTALQFAGKPALEIGCWLGWSTCHLALGGVILDVIDPGLANPVFASRVGSALQAAGVTERVELIAGYSPAKVAEIARSCHRRWSLIFIDGNHEAPGPFLDAQICEQVAADDALILFHDLVSPDVFAGWNYFRDRGWNVAIYQTKQIMGVAWRGKVKPIAHQPDPSVSWTLPSHLQWQWILNHDSDSVKNDGYYYPIIDKLVADNPGQMTVAEYRYIADIINHQSPGNLLIFGVGKDSGLWMDINRHGKTVFLEDSQGWLTQVKNTYADLEAYHIDYQTRRQNWAELLMKFERGEDCLSLDLPNWIYDISWDWILVDGPAGYTPETPGRMKSIYIASQLAIKSGDTDVFVHDCDRTVEIAYTSYFFKPNHLVKQISRLNHYRVSPGH